jgi:hypothetical protein
MKKESMIKQTEKQVLRAVTDYLELKKILYIRINPIRLFNDKQGHLRASSIRQSQVGAPDIIAFPVDKKYLVGAAAIAIECKSTIGIVKPHQLGWAWKWETLGNKYIYIIVRDIEDVKKWI